MRTHRFVVVALVMLALAGWTSPAAAQLARCAGDRERFCSDVPPGGGRLLGCLRAHAGELSEGCRQELGVHAPSHATGQAAHAAGGSAVQKACRQDVLKFCRSAIGDKTKVKSCMREHASELSDGCKTALIAQ